MVQMDEALADRNRTAALEQTGAYQDKLPAVILDIDETILNSAPFQAQLVLDQSDFDPAFWTDWVKEAKANWVPGAKQFIEYAREKNVAVIFITNRTAEEEASTRNNFSALGYTVSGTPDHLLTKEEQTHWTSDKTSRRAHVANSHRILLLIGDDLNDFVYAKGTPNERRATITPHIDRIGVDWFLVPNPLYGSWERALYQFATDCEMIDEKRSHLKGFK
jgi:acid phosphatase